MKPVMILHPDAAHPTVQRTLRGAGYCVIVNEHPEHFAQLDLVPAASLDIISRSAMKAISDGSYSDQQSFGKYVAKALSKEPKP